MLKIGHRGACGTMPENTLGAFRKAMALGADGVELDVHALKDGALAVIHDDTVDRTTNGRGRVARMTARQIQALRIGTDEQVPLLAEALAVLEGAYCFIEIKHDDAALRAAEAIARAVESGYPQGRLWLISFRHEALVSALEAFPDLLIGASYSNLTATSLTEAQAMGARAIIPHHQAFTAAHVEEAHALGLKVICWTVNAPADIARLKAMGVDGIMSDYPERLA